MKTIIISGGSQRIPAVNIAPDSAISKDSRPVFLPDEGAPWQGDIVVAYRVCRLGKNIPARFAHRYYDAITVATVTRAANDTLPEALALTADGAVSIGTWHELTPEDREQGVIQHTIGFAGGSHTFTDIDTGIANAIHHLSRYMTLKMGDIIIPAPAIYSIPLPIDTRVEASVDGIATLAYSIK